MIQEQVASTGGLATSTVRNTHRGAITNSLRDQVLVDMLEAVGKVRGAARKQQLARERVRLAA